MRAIGILVLLGAACASSSVTPARPTCKTQVAELRLWFDELVAEGYDWPPPFPPPRLRYAKAYSPTLRQAGHGPILAVTEDTIMLDGERMAPTWRDGGTAELDDLRAALAARVRPDGAALLVAVDAHVPWHVVPTLAALAAETGWGELLFIVSTTPRQSPPGPSTLDESLRARADELAGPDEELFALVYGGCPAVREAVKDWAAPDSETTGRRIAGAMPAAIEACGCEVDFGAVRAYHWWSAGRARFLRGLPLSVGRGGRSVSIAADTIWAKAVPALVAEAEHGQLLTLDVKR